VCWLFAWLLRMMLARHADNRQARTKKTKLLPFRMKAARMLVAAAVFMNRYWMKFTPKTKSGWKPSRFLLFVQHLTLLRSYHQRS